MFYPGNFGSLSQCTVIYEFRYFIRKKMKRKLERKINATGEKSTINPIVKCASCLEVSKIVSTLLEVHDSKQRTKHLKPLRSRMHHSIQRIFRAINNYKKSNAIILYNNSYSSLNLRTHSLTLFLEFHSRIATPVPVKAFDSKLQKLNLLIKNIK